jgi:hypothetical protein
MELREGFEAYLWYIQEDSMSPKTDMGPAMTTLA